MLTQACKLYHEKQVVQQPSFYFQMVNFILDAKTHCKNAPRIRILKYKTILLDQSTTFESFCECLCGQSWSSQFDAEAVSCCVGYLFVHPHTCFKQDPLSLHSIYIFAILSGREIKIYMDRGAQSVTLCWPMYIFVVLWSVDISHISCWTITSTACMWITQLWEISPAC